MECCVRLKILLLFFGLLNFYLLLFLSLLKHFLLIFSYSSVLKFLSVACPRPEIAEFTIRFFSLGFKLLG